MYLVTFHHWIVLYCNIFQVFLHMLQPQPYLHLFASLHFNVLLETDSSLSCEDLSYLTGTGFRGDWLTSCDIAVAD